MRTLYFNVFSCVVVIGLVKDAPKDNNPKKFTALQEESLLRKDGGIQRLWRARRSQDTRKETTRIYHMETETKSDRKTSSSRRKDINLPIFECRMPDYPSNISLMMVARCARSSTESDIERQHCEEETNGGTFNVMRLPVQDSRGVVYRNAHCAECNGVVDWFMWRVKTTCDNGRDLQFINRMSAKDLINFIESVTFRNNCRMSLVPVFQRAVKMCVIYTHYRTRREAHLLQTNPYQDEPFPISFSVLMNFGFDGKAHVLFSPSRKELGDLLERHNCKGDQMYYPTFKECRSLFCGTGYKLVHGACEQEFPSQPSSATPENIYEMLTDSEDMAKITLVTTVSWTDLFDTLDPNFNKELARTLASYLNISLERISNITISRLEKPHTDEIEIHQIHLGQGSGTQKNDSNKTHDDIHNNSQHHNSQVNDSSPNALQVLELAGKFAFIGKDRNFDTNFNTPRPKSHHGKKDSSEPTETTISDSSSYVSVSANHSLSAGDSSTTSPYENNKTPPNTYTELAELANETVTLNITFLILPRRDVDKDEESVKHILRKLMLSLESSFTITVNSTEFHVVDIKKADDNSKQSFCDKGAKHMYFKDQFDVIQIFDKQLKMNISEVYVNKTGRFYSPGQYDLTVIFHADFGRNVNSTDITGFVFVCVLPRIQRTDCARIIVDEHEYKLINKTIRILSSGALYNMSEYQYISNGNSTVEICIPGSYLNTNSTETTEFLACHQGYDDIIKAQSYLTLVLGAISIVAMAAVLITYSVFARLRNLPGVNIMNLTVALFLGELIFLLGGELVFSLEGSVRIVTCTTTAIILHYLFLTSFFWMSVMAYDVFKTFANKLILTRIREKSKYLHRYMLYAWGSPLLIVAICCVIDFANPLGLRMGYGQADTIHSSSFPRDNNSASAANQTNGNVSHDRNNHNFHLGCWIQEPEASMIAFGGPMLIIFLANAVLFVRTIHCIRAHAKQTHYRTRRSSINNLIGRYDVMLYVRMSTVMGFTWIFGLASAVVSAAGASPSSAMCYALYVVGLLFITFNCTQGLFIFFAFVFNRRVYKMYRIKLSNLSAFGRDRSFEQTSPLSRGSVSHIS